jgi:hypothetical protein
LRFTLDQAIHDATTAAPALQAATAQEQAARWRAAAASRSRFGQGDAVVTYSHFQDDQIVRPMSLQLFGPMGFSALPWDRDQAHYSVTYQLPLYQGGRLAASITLSAESVALLPVAPQRYFLPTSGEASSDWDSWLALPQVFAGGIRRGRPLPFNGAALATRHDSLAIAFSRRGRHLRSLPVAEFPHPAPP